MNAIIKRVMYTCVVGTNVTTYSLHPGVVNTELLRNLNTPIVGLLFRAFFYIFGKSPMKGAQTSIYCCTEPSLNGVSGRYYR